MRVGYRFHLPESDVIILLFGTYYVYNFIFCIRNIIYEYILYVDSVGLGPRPHNKNVGIVCIVM